MMPTSNFMFSHNVFFMFLWQTPEVGGTFSPFPKQQVLDSSKLIEFADNNFRLKQNSRKFTKWMENTVEKGEIARHKQFLLFPQCFQSTTEM